MTPCPLSKTLGKHFIGTPELLEKSAKKNEKYFTYFFFITNPLSIVVYLCRGEESGHLLWSLSWILPFKKMSLPFYFQKIVFPKRPISCYSLFDLRLSHWVLKLQQVPKIYHGIKYHLGQWIIIHLPIGRINFIYSGMYVWTKEVLVFSFYRYLTTYQFS